MVKDSLNYPNMGGQGRKLFYYWSFFLYKAYFSYSHFFMGRPVYFVQLCSICIMLWRDEGDNVV